MKCYLVYGPPAAGKTTLLQGLAKDIGYVYISVGHITRQEIAAGSFMGTKLKYYLDQNIQYPVALISQLVTRDILNLNKNTAGFILDGFPKYPEEVEEFVKFVGQHNIKVEAIIVVEVSLDETIKRVNKRRICQDCLKQVEVEELGAQCTNCGAALGVRDDDKNEAITSRYSDYSLSINKTLEALKSSCGRVIKIDGMVSREEALLTLRKELAL